MMSMQLRLVTVCYLQSFRGGWRTREDAGGEGAVTEIVGCL